MSNAAIIVLALIQHGPEMARAILTLFQKENPSQTDWELLFSTYKKTYEAYTSPITPILPRTITASGSGDLPPIP